MIKVRIPLYEYNTELIEKEKMQQISNPDYTVPYSELMIEEATFYSIENVRWDGENNVSIIQSGSNYHYSPWPREEVERAIDRSSSYTFSNSKS